MDAILLKAIHIDAAGGIKQSLDPKRTHLCGAKGATTASGERLHDAAGFDTGSWARDRCRFR